MIKFEYPIGHPDKHELIENGVKEKHKHILEQYPDAKIIFKWNGSGWLLETELEIALFHDVTGSDNIGQSLP